MKYIKFLILLLLLANCNQNLSKLNGHWKVYTKLNKSFNAEEDAPDEKTIFLDRFNLGNNQSINIIDICDGKLFWNKNALIESQIKNAEIDPDNKTFILTNEKGGILKLIYHFKKDSIFIEDINNQLRGYAIKTNPTLEDRFSTSPVNIDLLKINTPYEHIIKEVSSAKDILVFFSRRNKLFKDNSFPWMYINNIRAGYPDIQYAYDELRRERKNDSIQVFVFVDENIRLNDILKLLQELNNLPNENIFFALDNHENNIADIKFIKMLQFVQLLNIKKPIESNDDSNSITLKDYVK